MTTTEVTRLYNESKLQIRFKYEDLEYVEEVGKFFDENISVPPFGDVESYADYLVRGIVSEDWLCMYLSPGNDHSNLWANYQDVESLTVKEVYEIINSEKVESCPEDEFESVLFEV